MPRLKFQALTDGWARRATEPGYYSDGYGLTLRIDARGNKRWVQRLTIGGRQRNLGLGSWPAVSLDDAREMALANWNAAKEGRDPIAERHLAKMPSPSTFKETAKTVIALRRPTWSNEKHGPTGRAASPPTCSRSFATRWWMRLRRPKCWPFWSRSEMPSRRRPRGCCSAWKWCLTTTLLQAGAGVSDPHRGPDRGSAPHGMK